MEELINKYRFWLLLLLLAVIIYFPIFLHLDYMPFRMWDESILGANAIDMAHNHNYIVTWFYGGPDMSNCKPPLAIWCIVLVSKIIGFSELSLRLPSAIAAAVLCLYLFFETKKLTGNYAFGFFTVCVLVTCRGYIREHVTRTGEYDSLLVLFSALFVLNLFRAIEARDQKGQSLHIFLFFVFLTLGVLTKGVACMMLLPGILIYTLVRKKVVPFLKDKAFYAGLLVFVVFGLGYYVLREKMNPGYLKAVWENELGGRFGGTLEGHSGPIGYYINEMITWQFVNYLFLFPPALLAGLFFPDFRIRRLVQYSAVVGFSFLLVISLAGTKLPHYDAPAFPYLAIITATLFYGLYIALRDRIGQKQNTARAALIAGFFVISFLGKPYYDIIQKVYFPLGDWWEEGFGNSCKFFQQAARQQTDPGKYKAVINTDGPYGRATVLICYREELKQRRVPVDIVDTNGVAVNDSVLVFDWGERNFIQSHFETEPIKHLDYCNADVMFLKSKKVKS